MVSYFAGRSSCLHIFLVFITSVCLLMMVLAALPWTCAAGVPFWHVETTAVARIPIISYSVWVRGTLIRRLRVRPLPPPKGWGVEYQVVRRLKVLAAPLGSCCL